MIVTVVSKYGVLVVQRWLGGVGLPA